MDAIKFMYGSPTIDRRERMVFPVDFSIGSSRFISC